MKRSKITQGNDDPREEVLVLDGWRPTSSFGVYSSLADWERIVSMSGLDNNCDGRIFTRYSAPHTGLQAHLSQEVCPP